jgi:hypothetical protein
MTMVMVMVIVKPVSTIAVLISIPTAVHIRMGEIHASILLIVRVVARIVWAKEATTFTGPATSGISISYLSVRYTYKQYNKLIKITLAFNGENNHCYDEKKHG